MSLLHFTASFCNLQTFFRFNLDEERIFPTFFCFNLDEERIFPTFFRFNLDEE
jgi:hypothetical protein